MLRRPRRPQSNRRWIAPFPRRLMHLQAMRSPERLHGGPILGAPTRAGRIRSVLNQLRATGARRSATMPTSLPVMTTSRMRQPPTRLLMRLPEMLGPIATPIADRIDAAIGPRRTTPALGMIGKPSATRRPTDHGADAASGLRRITPARRMIGEPGATRRPIDHGAGATTDMTTTLAMMTAAARAAPHATAGGSCFLSSTNGEPMRTLVIRTARIVVVGSR